MFLICVVIYGPVRSMTTVSRFACRAERIDELRFRFSARVFERHK